MQDLAKPRAGEDQQPQGRCRVRTDDRLAIGLWNVLGRRARVVDFPWDSDGLGGSDRSANAHQFIDCEKAFSPALGVLFDTTRWVDTFLDKPAARCEAV